MKIHSHGISDSYKKLGENLCFFAPNLSLNYWQCLPEMIMIHKENCFLNQLYHKNLL